MTKLQPVDKTAAEELAAVDALMRASDNGGYLAPSTVKRAIEAAKGSALSATHEAAKICLDETSRQSKAMLSIVKQADADLQAKLDNQADELAALKSELKQLEDSMPSQTYSKLMRLVEKSAARDAEAVRLALDVIEQGLIAELNSYGKHIGGEASSVKSLYQAGGAKK